MSLASSLLGDFSKAIFELHVGCIGIASLNPIGSFVKKAANITQGKHDRALLEFHKHANTNKRVRIQIKEIARAVNLKTLNDKTLKTRSSNTIAISTPSTYGLHAALQGFCNFCVSKPEKVKLHSVTQRSFFFL